MLDNKDENGSEPVDKQVLLEPAAKVLVAGQGGTAPKLFADITPRGALPKKKYSTAEKSAFIAIILVAGVAAWLPWHNSVENSRRAAPALPATGGVLVVDTAKILKDVMTAVNTDVTLARIRRRQDILGAVVGKGIAMTTSQMADRGLTVIDASHTLAYPTTTDMTGSVERAVMTSIRNLSAQLPDVAATPAVNAVLPQPETALAPSGQSSLSVGDYPGRLP